MTDRTQHVLEMIDGALGDWDVSGDAMRWAPDAPPLMVPIAVGTTGAPGFSVRAGEGVSFVAAAVVDGPRPLPVIAAVDPVGDPGDDVLEAHSSMSMEWEITDGEPFAACVPVMQTGRVWITCGCGWTPNRPDGTRRGAPIDRTDAYHAWALHVPPAVHAHTLAARRWTDDHDGRLWPPAGWDDPGGDYDWRWWSLTVERDGPTVRITTRPPT